MINPHHICDNDVMISSKHQYTPHIFYFIIMLLLHSNLWAYDLLISEEFIIPPENDTQLHIDLTAGNNYFIGINHKSLIRSRNITIESIQDKRNEQYLQLRLGISKMHTTSTQYDILPEAGISFTLTNNVDLNTNIYLLSSIIHENNMYLSIMAAVNGKLSLSPAKKNRYAFNANIEIGKNFSEHSAFLILGYNPLLVAIDHKNYNLLKNTTKQQILEDMWYKSYFVGFGLRVNLMKMDL